MASPTNLARVVPTWKTRVDGMEVAMWADYCVVPTNWDGQFGGIFDKWEDWAVNDLLTTNLMGQSDLERLQGYAWQGKWQLVEERVYASGTIQTTTAMLPPQCSIVVSLDDPTTSFAQRPHRRNRRYFGPLAHTALGAQPNGAVTSAVANALIDAWYNLGEKWADLFDPLGAPQLPLEAPPAGYTAWGLGIFSPTLAEGFSPTRIRVGNIVDTRRSRRNQVDETYEERTWGPV